MNHFLFFDADVATRVCLTLAHSLWQFGLLALLAWLVARWLKRSSQQYLVHVAALLTGLLLLPATFAVIDVPSLAPDAVDVEEVVGIVEANLGSLEEAQAVYPAKPAGEFAPAERLELAASARFQESIADESMAKLGNPRAEVAWLQWFTKVAPWLLGGYVLGVVVMLARLLRAYWSAGRLAKCGEIISEGELHAFLSRLSGQWRLRAAPVLKQVETLVVPKVVGLLRPTILLPASALSGLTTAELEMILAHELAHVRRADLWVNLVQRIAEAVLFFNPPLWLLNRRISTLREYCCDELACGAASHRTSRPQLQYALALLQVVELKQDADFARTEQVAALAASGRSPSELRRRIARLFDEPLREPLPLGRGGVWPLLALGALLVTGSLVWAERGEGEEKPSETETVGAEERTDKQAVKLQGLITDETGQPLAKVKVVLYSGIATRGRGQETFTNAKGEYRFDPLETGTSVWSEEREGDRPSAYWNTGMEFEHPRYVPADGKSWRDLQIPQKPGHVETLDMKMTPGGKLSGVVLDKKTGEPLAELGLRIYTKSEGKNEQADFFTYATTDKQGRFTSDALFPGRYTIDINDGAFRGVHKYLRLGSVEVPAEKTTEIELLVLETERLAKQRKVEFVAAKPQASKPSLQYEDIRYLEAGATLEEATAFYNEKTAEERRTLFEKPIPDLTVEQLREALLTAADTLREQKPHAALLLRKCLDRGELIGIDKFFVSGVVGKDKNGKIRHRQVVPMLMVPSSKPGVDWDMVPLSSLNLIHKAEGESSASYGDFWRAEREAAQRSKATKLGATLAPQREVVASLEELYKKTKALHEVGAAGGETHKLSLVAYELATARSELAETEGKLEAAVEHSRAAVKAAQEHVEAIEATFTAGQVTLAEKVDSIKLRAKAKVALEAAEALVKSERKDTSGKVGDKKRVETDPSTEKPQTQSNDFDNHFIILPVTTPLQRCLLGEPADPEKSASFCVFINANKVTEQELQNKKSEFFSEFSTQLAERARYFNGIVRIQVVDDGSGKSFKEMQPWMRKLADDCEQRALSAEFSKAKSSSVFGSTVFKRWEKLSAETDAEKQPIDNQQKLLDEEPVGDELINVYGVRSVLSKLLTNATCVVEVKAALKKSDIENIPATWLPSLGELVPKIEQESKGAMLLKIKLPGNIEQSERAKIDAWVENLAGRKALAEQFGYEDVHLSTSFVAEEQAAWKVSAEKGGTAKPQAGGESVQDKSSKRLEELRDAVEKVETRARTAEAEMKAEERAFLSKPVEVGQLNEAEKPWYEATKRWEEAKLELARAQLELEAVTKKSIVLDKRNLEQDDPLELVDNVLPLVPEGAVRLTVPFAGVAGAVVEIKTLSIIQPGMKWLREYGTRLSDGDVPVVLDYMPPAEVPLRGVENFHAWIEERGRGDFINGMFMGQGPVAVRGAKLMRLRVKSWEETTQVTRENLLKQFKDVKPGGFITVGHSPKNPRSLSCFAVLTKEGELAVCRVLRVDPDKKDEMLIDLMKVGERSAEKPQPSYLEVRSARVLLDRDEIKTARDKNDPRLIMAPPTDTRAGWLMLADEGPIFTELDIDKAKAQKSDWGKHWDVLVNLKPEAAKRMKARTTELLAEGRDPNLRLAVLLDGKLLMAPTLNGTLGERVQISSGFDEQEAQALVEKLMPQKPDPLGKSEAK